MGRARLDGPPNVTVGVAVHPEVRDALSDAALRHGVSPAHYIRAIMHHWYLHGQHSPHMAIADRATFEYILETEGHAVSS